MSYRVITIEDALRLRVPSIDHVPRPSRFALCEFDARGHALRVVAGGLGRLALDAVAQGMDAGAREADAPSGVALAEGKPVFAPEARGAGGK